MTGPPPPSARSPLCVLFGANQACPWGDGSANAAGRRPFFTHQIRRDSRHPQCDRRPPARMQPTRMQPGSCCPGLLPAPKAEFRHGRKLGIRKGLRLTLCLASCWEGRWVFSGGAWPRKKPSSLNQQAPASRRACREDLALILPGWWYFCGVR